MSANKIYCKFTEAVNFTTGQENPCCCIECFVYIYHVIAYQSIFGYSLGHNVLFFDTLDEAKEHRSQHRSQYESDIYEIEMCDGHVVKILSKHFVSRFISEIIHRNGKMYYDAYEVPQIPEWTQESVDQSAYSQTELLEIDRQYQNLRRQ
jgi:hypothetical protein